MVRNKASDRPGPRPAYPSANLLGSGSCRLQDCTLIAEADHRIANHLTLLAGHVRLKAGALARQPEPPGREAIQLLLLGVEAEISAMARLHRLLSGGNTRAAADLAAELHEVCAPFRTGLAGEVALIEDFAADCAVSAEQTLPIAQIVTEVITNALKYAYAESGGGALIVRLRKMDALTALIEIVDHGPGFPRGFDAATQGGLGFRVVRALARQLGATATFASSGEGLRFKLTLPLAAAAIGDGGLVRRRQPG